MLLQQIQLMFIVGSHLASLVYTLMQHFIVSTTTLLELCMCLGYVGCSASCILLVFGIVLI